MGAPGNQGRDGQAGADGQAGPKGDSAFVPKEFLRGDPGLDGYRYENTTTNLSTKSILCSIYLI